jgi:hypothetical protein
MTTHDDTHGAHEHHSDPHGRQSEDKIDFVKVVAIGVVSLVLFAVCTYWALIILRRETARVHEASGVTSPVEVGRSEIGIVDQVPFTADRRLEVWKKERAARLHGYGWVDKQKGIAHIPIEQAIDQVVGGKLPEGAPR